MTPGKDYILSKVGAVIGSTPYAVAIDAGDHRLTADEPVKLGGQGKGPAPLDLLLSALGACTAATLKIYAERKTWPLEGIDVALTFIRNDQGDRIERRLHVKGPLDVAQRAKLADVAERTPVTLVIRNGVPIETELMEGQ
ncbi:OsmC family protein [Sphingomonas alpina]|uniref:OsmC family protein n=1 Tax=Sphingomonas alpina TaxID=653931 RepID=A0A7H0LM72_9SPHN|nr:OsmC family protein [Sphingomonas alpina]QNQ10775.1 OsmC family protein [Sphingomonas alpina]